MVRNAILPERGDAGFPHVRGDGPRTPHRFFTTNSFSPRAWGWSDVGQGVEPRIVVFPTCVGMVRNEVCMYVSMIGFPHVRGDGPELLWTNAYRTGFSPRAWGWSAHHSTGTNGH